MAEINKYWIFAGEASGDMHGASLVHEMLKIDSSLKFYGIGGNKLQEAGVNLHAHASEMSVVGITEVIPKLGNILGGITRDSIMQIAKRSGLKVQEKNMRPEFLRDAEEIFLTGTGIELEKVQC